MFLFIIFIHMTSDSVYSHLHKLSLFSWFILFSLSFLTSTVEHCKFNIIVTLDACRLKADDSQ